MKDPLTPKQVSDLLLLFTLTATIIGAGQFTLQYLDPHLTDLQKNYALFYTFVLLALFVLANFIIWRKDSGDKG